MVDFAVLDAAAARRLDSQCPDVYFTSGYGVAAAIAEAGEWRVAYGQHTIMCPYVQRRLDDGGCDAVSPYGYSGVYLSPGCSPAELAHFWSSAVDHWRECGLVTMFLRFSPLDVASVDAMLSLGVVEMTRRSDTISVPVNLGAKQVWARMAGRSRTAIRKARTAGLDGVIRPASAADLTAGSAFRRIYEQTMARVGSAPEYLFPDVYYRLLAEGLRKHLLITEVRDPAGTIVATALVLRHRDRVHYHLAGSDQAAARNGANNLLLWTILEWAAESGCGVVHLGGGVRADDGLFQFKQSFGGTRTPFWTGSVVLDHARYQALLVERARELGRCVDDLHRSGYFPAYRLGMERIR